MKTLILLAGTCALCCAGIAYADHPGRGGAPLEAALSGANEVPGPGDPDGSGTIHLRLSPGQGEVCYSLMTINVEQVFAGHIHVGPAGINGGVVVNLMLDGSYNGSAEQCVSANRATISAIIRNPENYYVNVHSTPYPAGAVRGQLEGLSD